MENDQRNRVYVCFLISLDITMDREYGFMDHFTFGVLNYYIIQSLPFCLVSWTRQTY
jgi:hypothetical protein